METRPVNPARVHPTNRARVEVKCRVGGIVYVQGVDRRGGINGNYQGTDEEFWGIVEEWARMRGLKVSKAPKRERGGTAAKVTAAAKRTRRRRDKTERDEDGNPTTSETSSRSKVTTRKRRSRKKSEEESGASCASLSEDPSTGQSSTRSSDVDD